MKVIAKYALGLLVACLFLYLLGAFYSTSFNIKDWSDDARTYTVLSSFWIAILMSINYKMTA